MVHGFHWVLPSLLGGCAQPGLLSDLTEDLEWLQRIRVRLLVTLTEYPLPLGDTSLPASLRTIHFPIDDMGIPTPRRTVALCLQIAELIEAERAVVVHCKAGLGRTGTILACVLVTLGRSPEDALVEVRRVCHHYIQTSSQEAFLDHFAQSVYPYRARPLAAGGSSSRGST